MIRRGFHPQVSHIPKEGDDHEEAGETGEGITLNPTDIDPENRLKIATFLVETHFPTPIWQSLCSMTRGVNYEFQFWVNDFRHWIGSDESVQAII